MIYAFAAALAKLSLGGGTVSFLTVIKGPLIEILGAIILGGLVGILFGYLTRRLRSRNEVLAVSLGVILICTGLSKYFNVSLILSNLSLGMVFANLFFLANRRAYQALQSIALPIYIIFFVIAGAHLQISFLPVMGVLGLVYIISRTFGLVGGAFLGATMSRSNPVIRKYLGLGILSQAGVAIGLAILVTREFSGLGQAGQDLAVLVINTIAATTIVFEIVGPIATKIAITRAGEIGKGR
jgi:Kef-type K+ transport system membrane component KefB